MSRLANSTNSYFTAGGTLPGDVPSYIERSADRDIFRSLASGEYAYILTSRQMGKSSLMVRTVGRLQAAGVQSVVLDLTAFGQSVTADQWYFSLAEAVAEQTDCCSVLSISSQCTPRVPMLRVFMKIVQSAMAACRLCIFIDEIDAVLALPFSTDEFFAAIRETYNRRSHDDRFRRLSFCLIGVATPSELIRDIRTTPFNIGTRIELTDFTTKEALGISRGLPGAPVVQRRVMKAVLDWTGGHPYLTQRVCKELADRGCCGKADVSAVCMSLFKLSYSNVKDDNLLFVRERLLHAAVDRAELLNLVKRVTRTRKVILNDADGLQTVLILSGLVRVDNGVLRIRNRIYKRAFNRSWIAANMPRQELRRQREAFRKGVLRASVVSFLIIGTLIYLVNLVRLQRDNIWRQLYVANLGLAEQAWEDHDIWKMRELLSLASQDTKRDLRGFEWFALWNAIKDQQPIHSFQDLSASKETLAGPSLFASTPDGRLLEIDLLSGEVKKVVARLRPGESVMCSTPRGYAVLFDRQGGEVSVWHLGQHELTRVAPAKGRLFSLKVDPSESEPLNVTCSPNDEHFAFVVGRRVEVRRFENGSVVSSHSISGAIRALRFSPDGSLIALATRDTIEVWTSSFNRRVWVVHSDQPGNLTFAPHGHVFTWADYEGVQSVDVETHQTLPRFPVRGLSGDLDYSPDGRWLVTSGLDCVNVWDVHLGELVQTMQPYPGTTRVRFLPDSTRLVAFSIYGDGISTWEVRPQPSKMMASDEVYALALSSDSKMLAAGGNNGRITLWDLSSRALIEEIKTNDRVENIGFADRGLLVVCSTHSVTTWDVGAGKRIRSISESDHPMIANVSRGGRWAAVVDTSTRIVSLISIVDGGIKSRWVIRGNGPILAVAIPADGVNVAVTVGNDVLVYGPAGQAVTLMGPITSRALLFGNKDQRLLVAYDNGSVYDWDWARARVKRTVAMHRGPVKAIVSSPDGARIVTASDDGSARFWDDKLNPVVRFPISEKSLECVAFSPDGRTLVASGDDRRISVWSGGGPTMQSQY